MENALYNENENPQQTEGQPVVDNVGQDTGYDTQETSQEQLTEEESSRYHQSRADKLSAEIESLKKYEKVGKLLESRPDLVQNMMQGLSGQQPGMPAVPERVEMKQDEFDPWEAFNNPESTSYRYREQQQNEQIEERVSSRMAGLQKAVGQAQLQSELVSSGQLAREEVPQFMKFVNENPANYGLENVVKMFRAVNNQNSKQAQANPLDQVRQTQQSPTSAGVLQGQQPKRETEEDTTWDNIIKAGAAGRIP